MPTSGRILSAHQGSSFVERFRRQLVSVSDAPRWTISTSRPTCNGICRERVQGRRYPVLRGVVHVGLAVSDFGIPRHRPYALNASGVRVSSPRSSPTKAHRRLPARRAGAVRHRARLPRRAAKAALASSTGHDHAVTPQARPHHGGTPPACRASDVSTSCWSPEMVAPGAKVLDIGAGDGELLEDSGREPRRRWARASSCRAKA